MGIDGLPDGAMVWAEAQSYLVAKGRVLQWSFDGYREPKLLMRDAVLLTPPTTLRALAAGYRPVLHPSAMAWAM
jgi:hypothetical protein